MDKMNFSSAKSTTMLLIVGGVIAAFLSIGCRKDAPVAPNAVDAGDEKIALAKIAEADKLYEGR